MGPKRQSTKKDPPVGEDDDSMGGSVGSRSSARLKRKRESAQMTGKALQFDAVREEEDNEEEEQEKRRTSKRVKKHHVEPFFVGHASSKPSKVEDVEMTVEYLEENDVEMMESSKPMDVAVAASTVASAVATTATAPSTTSVRKSAPTTSAALDRSAAQTQATIPPPSQRTPAVPTVPTPSLKSVRAASREEVPEPAPKVATAATDAPAAEDMELAPDVAIPPSATFWRTLGLDRTLGWLVLLLLLQLLLFPLWKQTIWSGTMALSNVFVSVFRWTDSSTTGQHPTQHELQQAMQTLDQLQTELQTLQQQEAARYPQWQAAMDADDSEAAARTVASLTAKVQQLQAVKDDGDDMEGLADVLELKDDDNRRGPKLLNLAPLQRLLSKLLQTESRNGSDGTCGGDDDGSSLNASLVDSVRSKLSAQVQRWQRHDTALHQRARSWIQRQVQEQVRRWQRALADLEQRQKKLRADSSNGGGTNARLLGLRRVLEERFQREAAGDDGRIDYASLWHGGRVVSASPSWVDTLPLLNRLAAFWRLRFYGHGPAVALTPTEQRLGHCWSMAGDAGQLTIELGRAIQVQSVVVEHVAPTDQGMAPSALRAFRVFGYESAKDVFTNSEGHALGTFEFDYSKAKRGRMEFPVKASPASVQFVLLLIDSNWGNPEHYTCLYRFRVHGQPVAA